MESRALMLESRALMLGEWMRRKAAVVSQRLKMRFLEMQRQGSQVRLSRRSESVPKLVLLMLAPVRQVLRAVR